MKTICGDIPDDPLKVCNQPDGDYHEDCSGMFCRRGMEVWSENNDRIS